MKCKVKHSQNYSRRVIKRRTNIKMTTLVKVEKEIFYQRKTVELEHIKTKNIDGINKIIESGSTLYYQFKSVIEKN